MCHARFAALSLALLLLTGCAGAPKNAPPDPSADPTAEVQPTPALSGETLSPDKKYEVRAEGVRDTAAAGGLYPADKIQIVDAGTEEILWETQGYYAQSALWSPDSSYLALVCGAQAYIETVLVDVSDFTYCIIPLPHNTDTAKVPLDASYVAATGWEDDHTLNMTLEVVAADLKDTFTYDVTTKTSTYSD